MGLAIMSCFALKIQRATPAVARGLGFEVSAEGPPKLFAFHDKPDILRTYSYMDHKIQFCGL